MKVLFTLLLALVPLTAADSPFEERAELTGGTAAGGCYNMWYCSGGHYMFGGPSGGYKYHHAECRTCITPGGCHPGCYDVDAGKKDDYVRMVAAAEHMDAEAVIDAAKTIPEFVFFNAQRSSVQVLSCDRQTVIASIPVEGVTRQLAAVHLSDAPIKQLAATE